MKIVYIAHPIGGDVQANLEKIRLIIRKINLEEPDTVPFAPYYPDCFALDDNNSEERERGIRNDHEFFSRGTMDEVRLYGDRLSHGMMGEVELASFHEIPVRPMSKEMKRQLLKYQGDIGFHLIFLEK